jgi:hypothetical protein
MFAHCNVVDLYEEDSSYFTSKVKSTNVGKPILHFTFGGSSHYGLCDLGIVVNVIPYEFYMEIQDELEPTIFEDSNMTIMLANKSLRKHMGQIKNASICVGAHMFPIDFVVVDMPNDYSCPIIFGRTLLRIARAIMNCTEKQLFSVLVKRK